jgi:alpha-galactosidase/6-phospho-beta-glucosidase family protein
VGGVFRALRTIPVMLDFARDMEEVCPDAWLLNYTNPMAMLTGAMLTMTGIRTVGLCHSVQAARSRKKEDIYRAVMLDPHTSAELSIDDIVSMCDEMIEAHRGWMPEYS